MEWYYSFKNFMQSLELRIYWHFMLAIIFFVMAVAMVTIIFISRLVKRFRNKRETKLKYEITTYINPILVNDYSEESITKNSTYKFNMDKLYYLVDSDWKRQVLVDKLVELRKSLTGSSATMLERIYSDLILDKYSIKKLSSYSWNIKAKGIKELSIFNSQIHILRIRKFLWVKNRILRNEAYFAMIQLAKKSPLGFLDNYTGVITPWMELNFFHHLSKNVDVKKIDFSRWFSSGNESVVLFAIRMSVRFRQFSTIFSLNNLLDHHSEEIKWNAAKALGELEAYEYADRIVAIHKLCWQNAKYARIWLKVMSMIADPERHLKNVIAFLHHPDMRVRLATAKALVVLNVNISSILDDDQFKGVDALFAHVNDPLLKS